MAIFTITDIDIFNANFFAQDSLDMQLKAFEEAQGLDVPLVYSMTIADDGSGTNTYILTLDIDVDSLTEIHVDGVTGHIAEIKISEFDGVGVTVDDRVGTYPGIFEIPVCVVNDDAYYYIGDPTETLDMGDFMSTTTFNTALNLDTERDYNVETTVIMADTAACDSIPAPNFVADLV